MAKDQRGPGLGRRPGSLLRARPWPFHPLLAGAYFVLFLYSVNLEETELGDVLPVLLIVVVSIGAALLVLGLLVGDIRRAALGLTATVIALFGYGHVLELLAPRGIGPFAQQVGWLVAVALAWLVAWRIGRWLGPATRALNVFAVVLVIVPLIAIVPFQFGLIAGNPLGGAPSAGPSADPTQSDTPDIYYLVWDRYPGPRSVDLQSGIENTLYDDLRARGLYVAERSHANYWRTSVSLGSTLSATLRDGRGRDDEVLGKADTSGPYSSIQNSNVARFLKARGYFYIHLGSDFSGTRTSALADVNPQYDNLSDFGAAFLDSTALPRVLRRVGLAELHWERRYNWTKWELDQLERLPARPGPEFVFAHILLPHTPYIFDADGGFIPYPERSRLSESEQFANQLAYTNRRLLNIVDHLLDRPEGSRPIVIVQADEGPYPFGFGDATGHDWTSASPEDREVKYNILNAWYVPDGRDIGLYPEISSVNTFRLLFNAYFDTDLPLLPDESYSRGHSEPLVFPP